MEYIVALLIIIGLPVYLASKRDTNVILWGIVGIVTAWSHWLLWIVAILCLAMAPKNTLSSQNSDKIKEVKQ